MPVGYRLILVYGLDSWPESEYSCFLARTVCVSNPS